MQVGVYPPIGRTFCGGALVWVSDKSQVEPSPRVIESPLVIRVAAPTLVVTFRPDDDTRYEFGVHYGQGEHSLYAPIQDLEGMVKVMSRHGEDTVRVVLRSV